MQCTALVIDDEPLARKRMISLLEPYASEIEILGEAGSGAQAVVKITSGTSSPCKECRTSNASMSGIWISRNTTSGIIS